jgi:hypothetical protein
MKMAGNPLAKLTLDAEYTSGPLATTDIHAGGIFFCLLYEEVLVFRSNDVVELDIRVLDEWRAMDDEADVVRRNSATGTYGLDGKGFLNCRFPNANYTGLPCDMNPDWLAFHVYNDRLHGRGCVYTLRDR